MMKQYSTYRQRSRERGRVLAKRTLLFALLLLTAMNLLHAQDFINTGTVENTGTFRAKNGVSGLPDSIGGRFDYFGGNQSIQPVRYQNLYLAGSGVKSLSGSLSSVDTVYIGASVVLDIAKGKTITLRDSLIKWGTLKGAVQKSVNLTGGNTSSNFGNIGAAISWSGNAPGMTTVLSVSDSIQSGNGYESIKRFYNIQPADTSSAGDITLAYSDAELNGHNPRSLILWNSSDNGQTWYYQGGTVDTLLRTMTKSNSVLSGRWTMADSLHPIGTLAVPGVPKTMVAVNSSVRTGQINTTATPFSVVIRDAFNAPLKNIPVSFSITAAPAGSVGYALSDTLVSTDSLGIAQASLMFGNRVGTYTIRVSVGSLQPVFFTAKASHGPASVLALEKGNNQTKKILNALDSSFTVSVADVGGNPVDGALVTFSIVPPVPDATGYRVSADTASTDSLGRASTVLTLGNKVGEYFVIATVAGVAGSSIQFTAEAEPGNPVNIVSNSILTPVEYGSTVSITVALTDTGDNPVPDDSVNFAIVSTPNNGSGERLSDSTVVTNAAGQATVLFTLGNKAGEYVVNATTSSIAGSGLFIRVQARSGAAATLTAVAGPDQTEQILDTLDMPFIVQVLDAVGNPVRQTTVSFAIDSVPAGAVGTAISASVRQTDSLGRASVTLTLGSKVGTYKVTAVVSGLDTLSFAAKATHGAAALFADLVGQNQIKPTGAALDTAFALSVHDRGDNPVPNVPVRFTVISAPANAVEYGLSDTVMVTDSSGVAYTYLQLGDRDGLYVVEASTQGVPQALFNSSGYYIYGDINRDFFVNIADITTIIDFFNKKSTLSATDSLKADFDRDGTIELADLDSIREHILRRGIPPVAPQTSLAEETSSRIRTRGADNVKNTQAIAEASTLLETTPLGLRVNLQNSIPVRGMELRIKLIDSTVNINAVNLMTHRSKAMNVFVRTVDQEVRVLVYNLSNAELFPDSSSVFRLPGIYAVGAIDTSQAILALQTNAAAVSNVFVQVAPVGKYPTAFSLGQNYPNPFNGATTIEYDIADDMKGTKMILQVFNILGQRIKTLVSGEQDPGHYKVRWDGTNDAGISVASGVYFYRFLTKNHGGSRKMLYLK